MLIQFTSHPGGKMAVETAWVVVSASDRITTEGSTETKT
jgi:hypothetical protein